MKFRKTMPMMTLDDEIAWWTHQAFKSNTGAALIAFGVATGLKLAKADYGARDANSESFIDYRNHEP